MLNDPIVDHLDAKRPNVAAFRSAPADEPYVPARVVEKPQLADYLGVLHRRRFPAISAFVIVFTCAVLHALTATPIYEARARVLIEAGTPNVAGFQDVLEESPARSDYYETQYNLLRSRSLARRTLKALGTSPIPAVNRGSLPAFDLRGRIEGLLATVASYATSAPAPANHREPASVDETAGQSAAIDAIVGGLQILPVRNSRIVDLAFRSSDPRLAAQVTNAHAKSYIEQNMEFRFLTSKDAADWLSARLAESRTEVAAAEHALQEYLEQHQAVSLDDGANIVVQRLGDMSVAMTRARTERIEKEAVYKQLVAIQRNEASLDTLPAVLGNAFVQQQKMELSNLQRQEAQMAEKFGDKHPEMVNLRSSIRTVQAKLQAEIARIVTSVRNDFIATQARERGLAEALDAHRREAMAMNQKAVEYGVLKREAESARQIYETLLQRTKETGVSAERRTSNLRIIDAAEVPQTPVSPNRQLTISRGFFGGVMLAVCFAAFFEYLDNRIKRPEEIKTYLGLPLLGIVPAAKAKGKAARKQVPLISDAAPPQFIEAIRTLRTNVLFSSAREVPRAIAVTSSGPSEGKTTIASNLAIALAQAGQRVLLVDGDMRRPTVHKRFPAQGEPGLSNLLVGNAKPSEVISKSAVTGLWLLTAGKVPPNPAELLGSRRFRELIASLHQQFEWVVIDTPPVLAVTDAAVVAHGCSDVVLIIGSDMVSRQSARVTLERLEAVQAHVLGAVLNRVDLERQPYYYSKYYRREYQEQYIQAKA